MRVYACDESAAAVASGRRILIPSGAIAGIDAITAAALGGLWTLGWVAYHAGFWWLDALATKLGVKARLGRVLLRDDFRPDAPPE